MRKFSVVVAATVGGMLLLPGVALADGGWQPVSDQDVAPSSLGPACDYHAGFAPTDTISVTVKRNRREAMTTTSGDVTTTRTRGTLVLTFAHVDANGKVIKTVTEDVSGPTTQTSNSSTTVGQFVGDGNNWEAFGPNGRINTNEPGLVFTSGHVVVDFTGITATSFSLRGRQEDGCRLLSGR